MSEQTSEVEKRKGYIDRVGDRAADIKVVALLLSLIALPFYVLGVVVAVLWLAVKWCYAAVLVGFADVKGKRGDAAG